MATRVWLTGVALLMFYGRLTCAKPVNDSLSEACSKISFADSVLKFENSFCPADCVGGESGVTEGDEVSLQRALNMVHKSNNKYVAVLFYASWCPFSRACRPSFGILSSLYPSIPHFAVKESAIRPSILSKYGVHGFPTLFLLNSTMRIRYHGSRTLNSFIAFYTDVTGIKARSDKTSPHQIGQTSPNQEKHDDIEPESCPFTWARSPENMLRQETYLALATTFVLLRLLHFIFPSLVIFVQSSWRRHIHNMSAGAIQVFNSFNREPYKRSNLQEGAMSAKAWASKSLASVSIGEASSSRNASLSERH